MGDINHRVGASAIERLAGDRAFSKKTKSFHVKQNLIPPITT